ncbi:hypothetical protein DDZ15_16305 [Rhodohalobacter mucosus]|uniref:6-bladed beta-propeller protein n=1 Tax=Rhodohalobacter mucosus TaxID=2079485 RepID=A0A316TYV2_9BACT|nr:hypothetical protein DDZ15_16305 [Rhodohalobacter mucosus]
MQGLNLWALCLLTAVAAGLLSCTGGDAESVSDKSAPVALEQINRWSIEAPDLIPNPSVAGVLLDGSLVILDRSLNTINHFDSEGNHLETRGGRGRGPGEYQNMIAIDIHPDGRVAVADLNSARVSISSLFSEEETTFPYETGWNPQVHLTGSGLVILNHPFSMMTTDPGDILMRIYDSETRETEEFYQMELEMENPPFEQISCTFCDFQFTDELAFYTAPRDTSYRVFRVDPDTGEELLFTRRGLPPVPYSQEEKEQLREGRERAMQVTGMEPGEYEPPEFKRRFFDFFPDGEGRLWVVRHTEAGEALKIDLFSPEAEYLGSLDAPENMRSIRYAGNGRLFVQFNNDNPDRWEGGVYRVVKL